MLGTDPNFHITLRSDHVVTIKLEDLIKHPHSEHPISDYRLYD